VHTQIEADLHQFFRPEFINRIDDTVIFLPLQPEEIEQIVLLLVEHLRRRMQEKGLGLRLTQAAVAHIAKVTYDPIYGARPLKRYLQRELETLVARRLIANELPAGHQLVVDVEKSELHLSVEARDERE